MKKILAFAVVVFVLLSFCCCNVTDADNEMITGDVKTDIENGKTPDDFLETDDEEMAVTPETDKTEVTAESVIEGLDCVVTEGGIYFEDAQMFSDAIKNADTETVAYYTGGKAEYYDFLKQIEISDVTLTAFCPSEEKKASLDEQKLFVNAEDLYIASFEVVKSDVEEFPVGKVHYYIGLGMDGVTGCLVNAFVKAERAENIIFDTWKMDYIIYFIKEFTALYEDIQDGRNYPESFDFRKHPHLITHLMARSGVYSDPPYTLEQINDFIGMSFDGNRGISLETRDDFGMWVSGFGDEESGRIYGCSYAHGGTSVEHEIVRVNDDGEYIEIEVIIYADFARLAKAKKLNFLFHRPGNGFDNLVAVEQTENTGFEPASVSI